MAVDHQRETAAVNLAATAPRRIISIGFHVRLTPPQGGELGDTDVAALIGRGLIKEAMLLLKNAGEAEGFVVDVEAIQVVY